MIRRHLPLFLSLACPLALHAQEANVDTFKAHKIPMIVDASGGFLLSKGKADDKAVHLLVDSGAILEFVMTKKWATDHGKELKKAGKGAGITGSTELFTTHLELFDLAGALKIRDFDVHVIDLAKGVKFPRQNDGTTPDIDGLIGCKFLMKSGAVISYQDNQLLIPANGNASDAYLNQSKAAGDRVIPLTKTTSGAAFIPIKFGEKEFMFLIDSAAGSNIILPEVAGEIGLDLKEISSQVIGAAGSTKGVKMGIAKNVEIGGVVKLQQFDFIAMPTPGAEALPADKPFGGILGNKFFSQLKTRIDFGSYHLMLPPLGKAAANDDNKKVIRIGKGQDPEEALAPVIQQFFTEVPIVRSTDGYYFVETKINDKARWMCLDSGADAMLLDNSIAKEDGIELTPGPSASGLDGKAQQAFNGKLKSFSIGPNTFEAPTLPFADLSNFSKLKMADGTTHPSAGQIGLAYFKALPVAVDFPKSRILVAKQKVKGGLTGLKAQAGSPVSPMIEDEKGRHYLVVEVAGKKALLLVDIGTSSSVLYEKATEDLKIETYPMPGTVDTLGRKNMPRKGAKITGLRIGDHELNGIVELMVLPSNVETVSGMPVIGMAGSSLFEALKSTVDFDTNEITLTPTLLKKAP